MECVFCEIAAGRVSAERLFEDDRVVAFLDTGPVSDGHTLVVPKEHITRLHHCSADVMAALAGCINKIAGHVADAMRADGYNVLCNNGSAAGQLVEHLHFHIIPRKTGDDVFNKWPAYRYGDRQMPDIARKIRRKLESAVE